VVCGKVKPHVQRAFPLAEASQTLAAVERGGTVGKVVLTVARSPHQAGRAR